MPPEPFTHPGPLEPFDERDQVFSRTRLRPGTPEYDTYYLAHPGNREIDDRTRALPPLASPGTRRYRAAESALVEAMFDASDLVAAAVEAGAPPGVPDGLGTPDGAERERSATRLSPAVLTRFAREAALFLGAGDVGIAPLDPAFVYSHRGRPLDRFGEPVDLAHRFAVVLVFPMRPAFTATSPEMASTAETARVYQRAAAACFGLARAFERLGVPARAHVDSSYLVLCPPLAEAAGLGEVGRSGILIHRTLGPGVRLGAVTVDAGLVPDGPRGFGIAAFCRTCGKCAENCPAAAIPAGDPGIVRGARKWPLVPERCYHYWRTQGTDCGVCVRTCPFAKPDTFLHRLVRRIVRSTAWLNRALLWADDRIYGAAPRPAPSPFGPLKGEDEP
jgi:ferredoxin